MKAAFSIMALCFAAACGGAGGSGGSIDSGVDAPSSMVVQSVNAVRSSSDRTFAGMLNSVRAVNGADPVSYNALLYDAAKGHADDMFAQDYFSHVSLDGRELDDRVNATGYEWRRIGENIGQGQSDEEEILLGWVTSSGHQANNIHPDFEDFGLAKAGSGADQYWVLVLADPL
ncbi:MAG: CAP domain-containing protein [Yoonia sp.]